MENFIKFCRLVVEGKRFVQYFEHSGIHPQVDGIEAAMCAGRYQICSGLYKNILALQILEKKK